MKRALGFACLVVVCIVGFLTIRGTMPFMPIFGSSMEPTLQSGSLLLIKPMDPGKVKVGDIIVFNVPSMVRDYYNYPPVVAHRVIEVRTSPMLTFRTKGDNTGEDPFTIRPQDLRGTVGNQIPWLGLPLLFFQSQQGMMFIIIALGLLALFLYGGELGRGGNILHRGIFAPVISEEKRISQVLAHKMESTEARMTSTEQALEKFAAAIELYAQHLASHTSAIQGLSEASHELKRGAAEQNRVLAHLLEGMEIARPGSKEHGQEEYLGTFVPELPQPEAEKPRAETEESSSEESPFPSGCFRGRSRMMTVDEILNGPKEPPAQT